MANRRYVALALIAFAFSMSHLSRAVAAGNELVVGQILDQSPGWIEAGRDYAAGAKTYFDVVNSEGGVNGRRIVYLTKDTDGSAVAVSRAALELAEQRVDVFFGTVGDTATQSLGLLRKGDLAAIPHFGPLTGMVQAEGQVRVLRAHYGEEAQELVRHFSGLGTEQFCMVSAAGEGHQVAAAAVRTAIAAARKRLVCDELIDGTTRDVRAAVATMQAKRPQAVVVIGDTALLGSIARLFPFKRLGVLLGGTSLVNHVALLQIAGPDAVNGVVLTQVVPAPHRQGVPIVREFVRAMSRFRDEPPSHLSLEGYIAAKALIDSVRSIPAAKALRKEDVAAAIARGRNPADSLRGMTDTGMAVTSTGKPIDVTMLRADGSLIR